MICEYICLCLGCGGLANGVGTVALSDAISSSTPGGGGLRGTACVVCWASGVGVLTSSSEAEPAPSGKKRAFKDL